jgi:hypothetical protein
MEELVEPGRVQNDGLGGISVSISIFSRYGGHFLIPNMCLNARWKLEKRHLVGIHTFEQA